MSTPHPSRVASSSSLMCSASCRAVGEDKSEVSSVSGQNSTSRCTARQVPGVQYMAVRWYKTESHSSHQRSGLSARNLPNGTTRWYKDVTRQVESQGESHDLFSPNVTCDDVGVYSCYSAAPVGQQNQEGKVSLTSTDCSTSSSFQDSSSSTESPVGDQSPSSTDTVMVIFASTSSVLALLISFISYKCLKNTVKDRIQVAKKEILSNAPLKPSDKKDLMSIYTLGPKTPTMKHICV